MLDAKSQIPNPKIQIPRSKSQIVIAGKRNANLEEADDGSSPRDFRAKERISLRELKESRLRLRILRQSGYLKEKDDAVIQESVELVKIVATIVRNSQQNELRERKEPRT
jgi:four helix bundle protein